MASIFENAQVALFFNQMTAGILDKLGINEKMQQNGCLRSMEIPNAIYCMPLMQLLDS